MKHNLNTEETAEQFLRYWENSNWYKMRNLFQLTWMSMHNRKERRIWKKWFMDFKLETSKIEKIIKIGKYMKDIKCVLLLKNREKYNINIRLICEEEPYKPDINGEWRVNPVSCKRIKKV